MPRVHVKYYKVLVVTKVQQIAHLVVINQHEALLLVEKYMSVIL